MIQEILGCCWIKRQLIQCSEEEILNALDTKYEFLSWLTCLENVVSKEKFIASDPKIFEKARNVLRSKKFDYSNSPEIFSLYNSLQGYFNEYDALPQTIKSRLQREWVSEQVCSRNLPIFFRGTNDILDLNVQDYKNLIILLNVSEEDHFTFAPFPMQSTIAWLINRHPEIFKERETRTIFEEGSYYKVRSGNHALTTATLILDIWKDPESGMKKNFRKKSKELQSQLERFGTAEEEIRIRIEDINPKRKRKG